MTTKNTVAKEMEKTLQPPLQVYQTQPIHGKANNSPHHDSPKHYLINKKKYFRARDDGRGFDKPSRTWTSTSNLSAQNETGEYCLFVFCVCRCFVIVFKCCHMFFFL